MLEQEYYVSQKLSDLEREIDCIRLAADIDAAQRRSERKGKRSVFGAFGWVTSSRLRRRARAASDTRTQSLTGEGTAVLERRF